MSFNERIYRGLPMLVRRLSPTESMLAINEGEKRIVVPTRLARLIVTTGDFKALENHIQAYWSKLGWKAKFFLVRDTMQWLEKKGKSVPLGPRAPLKVL